MEVFRLAILIHHIREWKLLVFQGDELSQDAIETIDIVSSGDN